MVIFGYIESLRLDWAIVRPYLKEIDKGTSKYSLAFPNSADVFMIIHNIFVASIWKIQQCL